MPRRPIRALHVVRRMDRAGVETWLMHLLRRLNRSECALDFLVQTAEPGVFDREIRDRGARVLPCLAPSQPWRYTREFERILNEYGPYDIVHSHTYFFSGIDLRMAAQAGVPMRVAHIHPCSDIRAGRPLRAVYRRWMASWIRDYATHFLAPSFATVDSFQSLTGYRDLQFSVIRNCVDLALFDHPSDRAALRSSLGIPADRVVITCVSRFAPHKNHLFLGCLADHVSRLGFDPHFVIAGSNGPSLESVRRVLGSRPDFTILVDPPDIAGVLLASDVFVFPSLEEGFGTVVIEAAAAGLPIVATDLPSIREACPPAHRGFLFQPNDAGAAAANIAAILHRGDAARLRSDALTFARQFSVEAASRDLLSLYRSAVGAPVSCAGAV